MRQSHLEIHNDLKTFFVNYKSNMSYTKSGVKLRMRGNVVKQVEEVRDKCIVYLQHTPYGAYEVTTHT